MNFLETLHTFIYYPYELRQGNSEFFDFPIKSYFINYYHFFFYILCHSYTGGNHEGATAIVASIATILILQFIHKLPRGLKCVHSLLGKEEALAIISQSLEKDSPLNVSPI